MANSPETSTPNLPAESPFDRLAQNIWQVLYGLLAVGAGLIIVAIILWFTKGWQTFVLELWLAGMGMVFLGSAVAVYRWLTSPNKELPAADLLRFLLLAIGGLAGFLTALLGPVLAVWQYSDIFGGGIETWRQNTRTILLCGLPFFVGLLLMFGGLMLGRNFERTQAGLRRLLYGYNAILGGLLLFAVLALLNLLAYTHIAPFSALGSTLDWTSGHIYTLEEGSREIIAGLKEPTEIYIVLQRADPLTPDAELLMENSRAVNPSLRYSVVSPDTDEAAITRLLKTYNIPGPGILILYGAPGSQVSEFIRREDLITTIPDPKGGFGSEQELFQGEFALVKALEYLQSGKTHTRIYFTQGNGELDFRDSRNRERSMTQLISLLGKGNYDLFPLQFDKKALLDPKGLIDDKGKVVDMSNDADLVVIAGPTEELAPEAIKALENYVKPLPGKKPGKLLVFMDVVPDKTTGKMRKTAEDLLARFNVKAGDNIIISARLQNPRQVVAFPKPDSRNPIVRAFQTSTTTTRFAWSNVRTIEPGPPGPASTNAVESLMVAAPSFWIWAEDNLAADPGELQADLMKNPEKLESKLSREPLPVAVTVSQSSLPPGHPGMAPGANDKPVMAVFGTSSWISNQQVGAGENFNLFTSCVSWLRERQEIGKRPNPPKPPTYEWKGGPEAAQRMLWLPGSIMLLVILSLSIGVWIVRRR
jgi:hypothetical protein